MQIREHFNMIAAVTYFAGLACSLAVSAVPTSTPLSIKRASKPLLRWTPTSNSSQTLLAFQAKIDWDLDNNHTIHTPSGLRASWWSREYV